MLVYFSGREGQTWAVSSGKDGWFLAEQFISCWAHVEATSGRGPCQHWAGAWAAGGGWDTPGYAHLTPPPGETSAEMSPQIAVKINSGRFDSPTEAPRVEIIFPTATD